VWARTPGGLAVHDSDLLLTLPDAIFLLANLALAFNPYHPHVQPAFDNIHRQHPEISISQVSDVNECPYI